MRRQNIRPTCIYWLVDTRPETIGAGWPDGMPFYCGKTICGVDFRFGRHKRDMRAAPGKPVSRRLRVCGDFVRVDTVEIVPIDEDWIARECHWIATLRQINPKCLNLTDGGDGLPGFVHSAESRAKMVAAGKKSVGRKHSAATIEKLRLNFAGKTHTEEVRARIGAAHRGKIVSPETRAKMRAAHVGKKCPASSIARRAYLARTRAILPPPPY